MSGRLKTLEDYIWAAIYDNYLVFIVVTSAAQGANPIDGFPYGAGKSNYTLRLLNYIYNGDEECVKRNMGYFEEDVLNMLERPGKCLAWGQEDMQIVFGKDRSQDPGVKALANILTGSREDVSVVIGNTPHLGKLAAAWRELWMFEVKIFTRGFYEVQQIRHYTPFKDPYKVKSKIHYKGQSSFPKVSDELEVWYKDWRATNYYKALRRYRSKYIIRKLDDPPEPVSESEATKAGRALAAKRWQD